MAPGCRQRHSGGRLQVSAAAIRSRNAKKEADPEGPAFKVLGEDA